MILPDVRTFEESLMQYYFLKYTSRHLDQAQLQSVIIDGLFLLDIQLHSLYC